MSFLAANTLRFGLLDQRTVAFQVLVVPRGSEVANYPEGHESRRAAVTQPEAKTGTFKKWMELMC